MQPIFEDMRCSHSHGSGLLLHSVSAMWTHTHVTHVAVLQAKGSDGSGYDGEDTGDADTEDGTDNGASSGRRTSKTGGKRARLGGPSSSNPETPGMGIGKGPGGNNSDPGAGAAGAGGYGMDLLQAYQTQYWDQAQNEVRMCLQCAVLNLTLAVFSLPCCVIHAVRVF